MDDDCCQAELVEALVSNAEKVGAALRQAQGDKQKMINVQEFVRLSLSKP
jgi:hypothetical protein